LVEHVMELLKTTIAPAAERSKEVEPAQAASSP
jgi:hypothetical protein